ncbi:YegJ family protein [Steroidobacter flavus]|uniref:YegJ family protein n=1 Tax=Steroidobacter flavus TaxID=1842136 RepID=A0ABV8SUD4_9GAMM
MFGIVVVILIMLKPEGGMLLSAQTDGVVTVSKDDPHMLAAHQKARDSLDRFLELAAAPPPNTAGFAVKVGISDGDEKEYFWITPFSRNGNSFSGQVNNTPRLVSTVAEGQEIHFDRADVVDWTYENTVDHQSFGNFTACALLVRASKEEAAAVKAEYGLDCDT